MIFLLGKSDQFLRSLRTVVQNDDNKQIRNKKREPKLPFSFSHNIIVANLVLVDTYNLVVVNIHKAPKHGSRF